MKLGIHQPQYLPWLHYFIKIKECDIFVLLDTVDYQKNGIQNRNQIKTNNGKTWLTVPVVNKLGQKIKDVSISNINDWKKKHRMTLDQFYNKSEFYKNYKHEIDEIYLTQWGSLSELNIKFIIKMLKWLNINTPIYRSSDLKVYGQSTELIINICNEFNAKQYISGLGGKNYLDENFFAKNNIKLNYLKNKKIAEYRQSYSDKGFINDLSALDIIFNCGDKWIDCLT